MKNLHALTNEKRFRKRAILVIAIAYGQGAALHQLGKTVDVKKMLKEAADEVLKEVGVE